MCCGDRLRPPPLSDIFGKSGRYASDASVCWILAQQDAKRLFASAARLGHRLEIDLRGTDRTGAAGAIDFPSPRFWRTAPVLHGHTEIRMLDHRGAASRLRASG